MAIRFFYNGLKVDKGRLQRGWYSLQLEHDYGHTFIPTQLTIYARSCYPGFSDDVKAAFVVENNSDSMTDYFESDRIRLLPSHPRFMDAAAAAAKALERDIKRCDKTGKDQAAADYRRRLAELQGVVNAELERRAA
jgi:hypothetical protein